jgi:hypothetical protein
MLLFDFVLLISMIVIVVHDHLLIVYPSAHWQLKIESASTVYCTAA